VDVGDQPSVERDDITQATVDGFEAADDRRVRALEDANDPSFDPLLRVPFDPCDDAIAVHGFGQLAGRNVEVLRLALSRVGNLRNDEPKAAGVDRQTTDDKIHLVGQPEPIAAHWQQIAGGHEGFELTLERGDLLPRDAKRARQLARRRRMVDVFANTP
jgi:hypothetical protein